VPEVLQAYLGGLDFIPYTRDLPKDSTSQKRGVATKTAEEIKNTATAHAAAKVPEKELVHKAADLNLSK